MNVGIISDIHANQFALKEVLSEAHVNNVKHLLILGDIVGYYYSPDIVLKLLSGWSYDMIKGNHEDIIINIESNDEYMEKISKKYGIGHKIALEKLNKDEIGMIKALPEYKTVFIDKMSILLSHGSPWDKNLYLYPDSSTDLLDQFDDYNFDLILFGHSHYPFSFRTKYGTALNPGSVGQSRIKGGVANWVLLNTYNKTIQFKETQYDTGELKKEVKDRDPEIKYNLEVLDREIM